MKIMLILPYFGPFNNYFNLWVQSCAFNSGIDWLLITDNVIDINLPSNIKYEYKSFYELKTEFQSKFDFKISLDKPYKLCDYKPYYGYLFEEYLEGYDFWGYCDCDTIFGDILSFLTEKMFQQYDKLLRLGHLSFVRNKKEINENFKKFDTYKIVLSSPVVYGYDESISGYRLGFAGELMKNGFKFYCNDSIVADIDFRYFPFRIVADSSKECVLVYENGKVYAISNKNEKKEYMYLHLQKRYLNVQKSLMGKSLLIYPNCITENDSQLFNDANFWSIVSNDSPEYYNFNKERFANLKRDIQRFVYEPYKIKSLKYRISGKGKD